MIRKNVSFKSVNFLWPLGQGLSGARVGFLMNVVILIKSPSKHQNIKQMNSYYIVMMMTNDSFKKENSSSYKRGSMF